jgi:hypothetical protein
MRNSQFVSAMTVNKFRTFSNENEGHEITKVAKNDRSIFHGYPTYRPARLIGCRLAQEILSASSS